MFIQHQQIVIHLLNYTFDGFGGDLFDLYTNDTILYLVDLTDEGS